MVDMVRRDDDDDDDARVDVINIGDAVVLEVAANKSAMVDDEAVDVAVDKATDDAGPEVIGSGSRRTPPALMLRWTLPNIMSIPPCRLEKAERDAMA
jgi:hypothetical protein